MAYLNIGEAASARTRRRWIRKRWIGLNRFMFELKQRGIYTDLNLNVYCNYMLADGLRCCRTFVAIGADGRVLMDSIPPGDFKLRITATKNDRMAQFPFEEKALAIGETNVTVPADASPATAISLGEILLKPQAAATPTVGLRR